MDIILEFLESELFFQIILFCGVFLIIFGLALFYSIKVKGKVFMIEFLLRNKRYDIELLKHRYIIQSVYTIMFGVIFFILALYRFTSGTLLGIIFVVLAIVDTSYDYFAIKSVIKKRNQ